MQEALKNPHYKKIWERMNWQERHPDCDNIEKALLHESTHKGCLIALDDKPCHILPIDDGLVEYDFMRPNIAKLIHIEDPEVNDIECEVCNNYLSVEGLPSYIASINKVKFYNPQILGRPITLFDVLKLLQKNIENGEFALMTNCVVLCNIDVTRNTSNDIFQYFVKKICDINNKSNLIEEQTPETWEKIANLI